MQEVPARFLLWKDVPGAPPHRDGALVAVIMTAKRIV